MHSHLVTVEVGVECGTDQRVQLNRLALDQNRFKCLDTQTMQSWCTVKHHRMLMNHFSQNIPDFRNTLLYQFLGSFDGICQTTQFQLVIDKRLEQFECHFLRQPALVQLQLRTHHDYRTTGVIHTFTEQVLTETTLFTLDHIRE